MLRQWSYKVTAILVILATGCGSSAAIERTDGLTITGRIDSGDDNRLYVTVADDERYAIERADIAQIDHPGRGGMIFSTVPIGIGLGFLTLAPFLRSGCGDHYSSPSPCWNLQALAAITGISYLLVGLPVLLISYRANQRSKAAAATPLRLLSPVPYQPLAPAQSPRGHGISVRE